MKTTIASVLSLFGLFTNANAETILVKGINFEITTTAKTEQSRQLASKGIGWPAVDLTIFDPETIIAKVSSVIEESIAEDLKITGSSITYHGTLFYIERSDEEIATADRMITESQYSTDLSPLYLDKTVEDMISENNQIIESRPANTQPLDFSKIDRAPATFPDNKKIIGMN